MTREEAIKFESALKNYVAETKMNNLSETQIYKLVDSHVEIYPDDPVGMDIYSLGKKSFSVRPGNISFHLREFIAACVNLALGTTVPTTPQEVGIFAVRILLFLNSITPSFKNDISNDEAYIVAFLHTHNMYEWGVLEDDFNVKFNLWYFTQTGEKLSDIKIRKAIDYLMNELKSIIIIDGEIRLKERVWVNKL